MRERTSEKEREREREGGREADTGSSRDQRRWRTPNLRVSRDASLWEAVGSIGL